MPIDLVSQNIISLALMLDKRTPGLAAEVWIDESTKNKLKSKIDDLNSDDLITSTQKQINLIADLPRKVYLSELLNSLTYQFDSKSKTDSYTDFSQATFGFKIERVTENEIKKLEFRIHSLEKQLGKSRQEVCHKYHLEKDELLPHFAGHIEKITNALPSYLFNYPDEGVSLKLTENKPWGAFNSHVKPFQSEVTLNADVGLTDLDLKRLACHEVCGGHHTELSNKDQMLTVLQRGEHGIVVTYSPQTFVSEAIAESMFDVLGILNHEDNDMMMAWHYDRLVFALQNLATYLYFDDKLPREEIDLKFKNYAVSDQSRQNLLNFSCDPLFGRYAPVYHAGYQFLKDLYEKTDQKERLVKVLFSQPCTPTILTKEFLK
jgi:hypothetical protein